MAQMGSNLKGPGGELRMTVQITRKATGKTETVELVGTTTPEQHEAIMKEMETKERADDRNALDGE